MKTSRILLAGLLVLPLVSCRDLRSDRSEALNTEHIQYPMPQGGEVFYEGHGSEEWFAYGAMGPSADVPANGVAQAHRFQDGRFLHTIQLNVQPAQDGFFYEGWLTDGTNTISTGHLNSPTADARHGLRFEADQDYTAYTKVIVTLEADDVNPAPGLHIAEGTMKVTER